MSEKLAYINRLPFYAHLSAEEIATAERYSAVKNYKKGSIIHGCGNDCLGMIFLIAGEVRAYILSEEGREITLFRMHPDDVCVLSASCVITQITFDTQIVAEKDCTLLVIGASAFARLTEQNIYVRCYMYELLSERFSSVMWTMQQILFKGFDKRLASFLITEYRRTGKKTVKMTHEQIALHTSSAREVVARMLKRFAADGLVEYKRGIVKLLDIDALADTAN